MTYTVWSSSVLSPACDGTQWGGSNGGDGDGGDGNNGNGGDGGDGGDGGEGVSKEDDGEDDEEDGVLIRGCHQRTARFNAKVKPLSLNSSNFSISSSIPIFEYESIFQARILLPLLIFY